MTASDLAAKFIERFGDAFSPAVTFRDEITLTLKDEERIEEICSFARKELGFDYLVDLSGVDNYGDDPRFSVVYELYGYGHRQHLRLKIHVSEEKCEVPTVSRVWRTADWHEREAYDMLGIRFRGHPNLTRILMWEGYPFFPLRKDFPLAGKPSEMPDVAFTSPAPLEGGPFVTVAGGRDTIEREPRARHPEADELKTVSRLERRRDLGRADDQQSEAKGNQPK